jgi:UDP-N-acetylmuramate--alanine ligase
VGIGGIGLSAIAEILLSRGYEVSGSDMKASDTTSRLKGKGATVFLGHDKMNVGDADLLVYTSAASRDNPEITEAIDRNIPAVSRAELLGTLMEGAKNSIAVAGTHGKTTTTSMVSLILNDAGFDPTILVGGNLAQIEGNVRSGGNEYFVTEACEYMDSFLELRPKYAIVLNIDTDHLDYFKDLDHIVNSFMRFIDLVPKDGAIFAYDSNPLVSSLIKGIDKRVVTFGFHDDCDVYASNIKFSEEGMPGFDLHSGGLGLGRIELKIPGEHNIANALAAFSCCAHIGVADEKIKETLEGFTGTQRRFDIQGYTRGGVKIVDDYAHHPAEITATIKAAKNVPHEKMWVLFQPHTYTRTIALHDDFAEALLQSDRVVLAEIYAAREKNIHKISSRSLVDKIRKLDPSKEVYYFNDFSDIAAFVLNNAGEGDLVITMGAGDIYKVGETILEIDGGT